MEKTLVAFSSFPISILSSPAHLHSSNFYKVSPYSCFQRPSSPQNARSSLGVLEVQWRRTVSSLQCTPRIVCFFGGKGKGKADGDDSAKDAARKALEKALGGKKRVFSKWDEEIKKREEDVVQGGGGARGGGWFSGGGGGDSGDEDFWEETVQVILATIGLVFVYLMIIKGKEVTSFTVNSLLFLLRRLRSKASGGSESPPEEESRSESGYSSDDEEDDYDSESIY
eukprot:Gb_08559 [translate_table: standard]